MYLFQRWLPGCMAKNKNCHCAVTSSRVSTEQELQNALKLIDSFPEIERTITDIEWL